MMPAAAPAIIAALCATYPGIWPQHPLPSALPAQIEQETCVTLKSAKCFSPHAELKTTREYGFGLGQLTVTPKFNNFNAVKAQYPALRGWAWADRFNARLQLVALVSMDATNYRACSSLFSGPYEGLACSLSAYNGGLGGVRADRRLCANTHGCNPRLWFNGVARVSTKAKTAAKGYGQSFYQINRSYVENVLVTRRAKYVVPMTCEKGN
jgi:hypothetical protein